MYVCVCLCGFGVYTNTELIRKLNVLLVYYMGSSINSLSHLAVGKLYCTGCYECWLLTGGPGSPGGPTGPGGPGSPVAPGVPFIPSSPSAPSAPARPGGPWGPDDPGAPI